MAKEIELEEDEAPKRGRPKKSTEDIIFGDNIDNDEEKRLREEAEISRILDREDAAESTIVVSRRTNRTQRYAHLAEIGIRDYNREELARQYGGGEYRCRIRRGDGQFGATWYFPVDPSRKPEADPDEMGTAGGVDAVRLVETVAAKLAPKEDTNGKMNEMVQMMMSKSDDLFKMMMVMQQENTKLLMAALSNRPQQDNTAMSQMSTMLLKHSLDQSQTRMDDMIATIIKLKKLSDDNDRGGDDEEPKGSFVQDLMSAIPQVLKSFSGGAPAGLPAQSAAPQVLPVAAKPQEPSGKISPDGFGAIMNQLLSLAQAGSDPEDVHNTFEPLLSDEQYDQIADFLEKTPDWFEQLCAMVPQAAPHRKWFEELRDVIIAVPEDDEEDPVDKDEESDLEQEIQQTATVAAPVTKPKAKKTKG